MLDNDSILISGLSQFRGTIVSIVDKQTQFWSSGRNWMRAFSLNQKSWKIWIFEKFWKKSPDILSIRLDCILAKSLFSPWRFEGEEPSDVLTSLIRTTQSWRAGVETFETSAGASAKPAATAPPSSQCRAAFCATTAAALQRSTKIWSATPRSRRPPRRPQRLTETATRRLPALHRPRPRWPLRDQRRHHESRHPISILEMKWAAWTSLS